MINGTFDVRLDTPKTFKRGTIELKSKAARIEATVSVGSLDGVTVSGTCEDKSFDFEGSVNVDGYGEVGYHIAGELWGNSLEASGRTDIGTVEIRGTSISTATGDSNGKPGSMYAGRWSDGY